MISYLEEEYTLSLCFLGIFPLQTRTIQLTNYVYGEVVVQYSKHNALNLVCLSLTDSREVVVDFIVVSFP